MCVAGDARRGAKYVCYARTRTHLVGKKLARATKEGVIFEVEQHEIRGRLRPPFGGEGQCAVAVEALLELGRERMRPWVVIAHEDGERALEAERCVLERPRDVEARRLLSARKGRARVQHRGGDLLQRHDLEVRHTVPCEDLRSALEDRHPAGALLRRAVGAQRLQRCAALGPVRLVNQHGRLARLERAVELAQAVCTA